MNNEIKEILDMLKDSQYIPSDDNRTYKLLDREDTRRLLDYITNLQHQISLMEEDIRESKEINGELQQENETLHENNQNMQEEMARVWEENERLKEKLEARRKICLEAVKREQDYKSRCEKAVEFIKERQETTDIDDVINTDILLNILQNGSEEK